MTSPLVGIDLGTTNSLVCVYEEGTARPLTDDLGHTMIPSALALDDEGHLTVGAIARERMAAGLPGLARFKPFMGTDRTLSLGDHRLRPEEASALVLRELKAMAERRLGTTVSEAVVTVPAWFGEPQRRATLDAAVLAGLQVTQLLNEPTAAAIAYGVEQGDDPQVVGVIDLGGGTFDITILELFDGVVEVMGSTGDTHLGGEDFTDALIRGAAEQARVQAPTDGAFRAAAEHAKRRVCSGGEATLQLGATTVTLDEARLRAWCAPLVARLERCIREAMFQAKVRAGGFDRVLLVGGAARMPLLGEVASRLCGRDAELAGDLDHVVGRGAALQAGLHARHWALSEVLVTDVLTHTLGTSTTRSHGGMELYDRFSPILSRGTTLPATARQRYWTLRKGQTFMDIEVYEGEARHVRDNTRLGQITIDDIPENQDDHEAVWVRFTHDVSGLLVVDVEVESTGKTHELAIERTGRSLRPSDLEAARRRLAALRIHPRELLPNKFLWERANRLVTLTSGPLREHLDHQLTAFEAAMETGDADSIDQVRRLLQRTVTQVQDELGMEL